jgi:hypothetical protein
MLPGVARIFFYMVLSTWVVFAFLSNWRLQDGTPRHSFQAMLDGTAHKPFVYRSLWPSVVNNLEPLLPTDLHESLSEKIAPRLKEKFVDPLLYFYGSRIPGLYERINSSWRTSGYRVKYVLTVSIMWLAFFSTLLIIHHLGKKAGGEAKINEVVPVGYALVIPTMFLNGGFFYDFIEQFFMALALLMVLNKNVIGLFVVILLSQLNKETTVLLPIIILPVIMHNFGNKKGMALAGLLVAICSAIYAMVVTKMSANPGVSAEWHLFDNIAFWSTSANYFKTADMHAIGINLPRMSLPVFLLILLLGGVFWGAKKALRSSALIGVVILLPLMATYGFRDEFRAVAMIFPLLCLLALSSSQNERNQ